MKKSITLLFVLLALSLNTFAQGVFIGPRLTGNLNIWNRKSLVGTWNGIGVGIGGAVDLGFSSHLGMLIHLTPFDMRSFSNSQTVDQTTTETSLSLSYFSIDPMFKAEFSGFYMFGGPSIGIKINSSGERTTSQAGANPNIQPINIETKSVRFDIAVGTGYNFKLTPDMLLGSDFMVYIPLTDTYNMPGLSNSILTLKLGASLKFKIN